jgi:hypothetical protein
MNDMDDLIRASLHQHTPTAPTDEGLAGRVATAGRRVRRIRAAGAATLALALVAGAAWAATALPRSTDPGVAAYPSPTRPAITPTAPSSTPTGPAANRPSTSADGTVRDVSTIGGRAEFGKYTFLNNFFASPSGNLFCFINTAGAGCTAMTWATGVEPAQKQVCADREPVLGPEVWGKSRAAWACGSDPHSFPFLNGEGDEGVAWWDADFGKSTPNPVDPTVNLAVLPYGRTLVAGDLRCSMATDGVRCTNTRTGEGFHASRDKVTLHP